MSVKRTPDLASLNRAFVQTASNRETEAIKEQIINTSQELLSKRHSREEEREIIARTLFGKQGYMAPDHKNPFTQTLITPSMVTAGNEHRHPFYNTEHNQFPNCWQGKLQNPELAVKDDGAELVATVDGITTGHFNPKGLELEINSSSCDSPYPRHHVSFSSPENDQVRVNVNHGHSAKEVPLTGKLRDNLKLLMRTAKLEENLTGVYKEHHSTTTAV